jgi:hypothetical protein
VHGKRKFKKIPSMPKKHMKKLSYSSTILEWQKNLEKKNHFTLERQFYVIFLLIKSSIYNYNP